MTKGRILFGGIDVGSLSTDVILLDRDGFVAGQSVIATGASAKRAVSDALDRALSEASASREEVACLIATGYGRNSVPGADQTVTEITCHARGASHLFPGIRTVFDIGGQDSKVIRLLPDGRVSDFAMNDKCAAGTGRFLEVMARTLEMDLDEMGERAAGANRAAQVSSMCTVFAESEVVSLIADGTPPEEIAWGVHVAIAERIAALAERVGITAPAAMTGGVAKNRAARKALEERLGVMLLVPSEPQVAGALGAALFARDRARVAN